MDLSPMTILASVLAVIAGVAVVRAFYRVDDRTEDRRKMAIELSNRFSALGLTMLAEFFTDYAVGDYSGCIGQVKRMYRVMADPEEREKAFDRVFRGLFAARVKDAATRAELRRQIDEFDQRTQEEAAAAVMLRNAQAQAAAARAASATVTGALQPSASGVQPSVLQSAGNTAGSAPTAVGAAPAGASAVAATA